MSDPITITFQDHAGVDGVTVVAVRGSIDSDTAPIFERELESLLQQHRSRLLVDLAEVDYISSAGIGIFVSMLQEARSRDGGDVKVARASKKLMKVFDSIGLSDMMDFFDQVEDLKEWSASEAVREAMDHFALSVQGEIYSGEPFTLKAECLDAQGHRVEDYLGRPKLTASSGLVFPAELTGFSSGVWEGEATVTGSGTVTVTLADGGFSGSVDVNVQERSGKARFPLTVACKTCQTSLTVREPDVYRCEHCDETFYVDAWGHTFTLKPGGGGKRRKSRYKGLELKINADVNYLSVIRQVISGICLKEGMDDVTTNSVALAIDEILLNLIEHGNDFDPWQIFRIRVEFQKKQLKIQIRDYGEPFDVTRNQVMSIKSSVAKGLKRGVGTFLVNQLMDQVKYESLANYNQLTMIKQYADPGEGA